MLQKVVQTFCVNNQTNLWAIASLNSPLLPEGERIRGFSIRS